MFEPRRYRDAFGGKGLVYFDCAVKETDLRIGASAQFKDEALRAVTRVRASLEDYIRAEPSFLTSLEPVRCRSGAPPAVRSMCAAAKLAGVGPMAAVAGAIGEFVGRELLRMSPEVIVENGGDIFMRTRSPRKIGIYAGPSPLSQKLAIEVTPEMTPMGICTSSGTFGHSLSFGKCDAAVILAADAALSDAVATATANRVQTEDDLEAAAAFAARIRGVMGAVVIKGERMAVCGEVRLAAM